MTKLLPPKPQAALLQRHSVCDTLLVDSMFQFTKRQTRAAMNFLHEGDWRCSFDVFESDRFNNISHQEFINCITEVRLLCL